MPKYSFIATESLYKSGIKNVSFLSRVGITKSGLKVFKVIIPLPVSENTCHFLSEKKPKQRAVISY